MQCEYRLIGPDTRCERLASHVHVVLSYGESKSYVDSLGIHREDLRDRYVCSDHSFASDKSIHEVSVSTLESSSSKDIAIASGYMEVFASQSGTSESQSQRDALRVIEASSKPNKAYSSGAVRPTSVWYQVIRMERGNAAKTAFVMARFRYESDAVSYVDLLRSRGTDYHYTVKAGR